jgi:hemerythrin-like domain-containing protein
VQDFSDAYAAHIQREESELLPMAARLIPDDTLAGIGQAMKARRGGEAG